MTDENAVQRVNGRVLSKAGAAGKAVRQSSGGVLSNAVAGGIAARLPGDGDTKINIIALCSFSLPTKSPSNGKSFN